MSTLYIEGLGWSLPTDFSLDVNKSLAEKPRDVSIGACVINRYEREGYVLVKNSSTAIATTWNIVEERGDTAIDVNLAKSYGQGHTKIEVTIASVTKDQYQGGKLIVYSGTGIGQQYPIAANTATNSEGIVVITLATKTRVHMDITTDVRIITNPDRNVGQGTAGRRVPLGVVRPVFGANHYAWAQYWGVTLVKSTAAITSGWDGSPVVKAATGGVAIGSESNTVPIVGYPLDNTNTEVGGLLPIQLALPPVH